MEQFTLTYETKFEDGLYKIRVYPSNTELSNKVESFLNVSEINQTIIDDFITEQTPLLFGFIQELGFNNYYL